MKVTKIRVQNFKCIADSSEIPIDERLTILVGKNEAGKTALLEALACFNRGANFTAEDLSQISGARNAQNKAALPMVTVRLTLSTQDKLALGIPSSDPGDLEVDITKTFGNEYRVCGLADPASTKDTSGRGIFLDAARRVLEQLKNVYRGRVKRKLPLDQFVFLERFPGEQDKHNLVLFPEWASEIWDGLEAGDWVLVTRIEADPSPYDRNARAMNAGIDVDLGSAIGALNSICVKAADTSQHVMSSDFTPVRSLVGDLPESHPVRAFLNADVVRELERVSGALAPEPTSPVIHTTLLTLMPEFVYVDDVASVSDSMSLTAVRSSTAASRVATSEPENLLDALVRTVGFSPSGLLQQNNVDRKKTLEDKSAILTQRLREYWPSEDVSFELGKDGERLEFWINSANSNDPPSRRSKGLSSYVSLFAKLADFSGQKKLVALFDDPGVYLHPVAQQTVRKLLDAQPFQVITATHLPFLIDPDRVDRVRVVSRVSNGSKIESDWSKAQDSLLPVWGSLIGTHGSAIWLLVEGQDDQKAYLKISAACEQQGRKCLPKELRIVPGGGAQLPVLAERFLSYGGLVIALLDGDQGGLDIAKRLLKMKNRRLKILTLDAVVKGARLEELFVAGEFANVMSTRDGLPVLQKSTLDRFETIFKNVTVEFASLVSDSAIA